LSIKELVKSYDVRNKHIHILYVIDLVEMEKMKNNSQLSFLGFVKEDLRDVGHKLDNQSKGWIVSIVFMNKSKVYNLKGLVGSILS
jgi:hypothetical protein